MKRIRDEKGQSMVEFALVVPVLLLLVFGIIDFGWLLFNRVSIENGAREGARYAAVNAADCADPATELMTEVENRVAPFVSSAHTVTITSDGTYIRVTVTGEIPVLTPIVGAFYEDNICQMSSAVEMHIEKII